jgi:hypothetical protein
MRESVVADAVYQCRRSLWAGKPNRKPRRGLTIGHLECDEIWTFVAKKQARLTLEDRALRSDIGDMFVWTALDQETRLIPAYTICDSRSGRRTRLAQQLGTPA